MLKLWCPSLRVPLREPGQPQDACGGLSLLRALSRSRARALSLSLTHTHTLSLSLSRNFSLALALARSLSFSLSLCLSVSLDLFLSLFLSLSRSLACTCSLALSLFFSLYLSLASHPPTPHFFSPSLSPSRSLSPLLPLPGHLRRIKWPDTLRPRTRSLRSLKFQFFTTYANDMPFFRKDLQRMHFCFRFGTQARRPAAPALV